MRLLISIAKHNRFFLLPWLALLIPGAFIIGQYPKDIIHLYTNRYYSPFWDEAMQWVTLIGDGWTITVFVLLMFAWNRRLAFFTGITCLLASGITHLLKYTIYYGEARPVLFFAGTKKLRLVPNIDNAFFNTFPSGHTTVSFAFFFCLALGLKNEWYKAVCLFVAASIGFSRIYLSQHFLQDVYFGSIIGTLTAVLIFYFVILKKRVSLPDFPQQQAEI